MGTYHLKCRMDKLQILLISRIYLADSTLTQILRNLSFKLICSFLMKQYVILMCTWNGEQADFRNIPIQLLLKKTAQVQWPNEGNDCRFSKISEFWYSWLCCQNEHTYKTHHSMITICHEHQNDALFAKLLWNMTGRAGPHMSIWGPQDPGVGMNHSSFICTRVLNGFLMTCASVTLQNQWFPF